MSGTLNTYEEEYKKDSNIKPEDIRSLLEWVKKEPSMPQVSEYQLIQFYHSCEYSMEATKRVVKLHYTFKHEAADLYLGQDYAPPKYDYTFRDIVYCFDLPATTSKGYRIMYFGLKNFDPTKYNLPIVATMQIKTLLMVILEQGICPGYSIVMDYKGFGFSHLATLGFSQLKKLGVITQETCQMKIKEVHLINGPGVIDKLLTLTKPLIKKEMLDMIRVHSDMKALFEHLGKENIPADLGGTLPLTREELNESIKRRFASLSNEVQKEMELRSKESFRSCGNHDIFSSSNGSFKKIEID